jgi:sec-independent protein translocase protein TatC
MEEPQGEMSFLDHLEELRWHLVRSCLAILIIAILAFANKGLVFDMIILGPMHVDFVTYRFLCYLDIYFGLGGVICLTEIPFTLFNLDMTGQFTTHLMVSAICGLVVAFPYIVWETWRFISPGLNDTEKKYSAGVVFFSSILFLCGILFGYLIIAPMSLNFLGSYQVSSMVANQINLGSYISTMSTLTLASGIVFELPIVIYFLTKIGLVTPAFMKQYRRHALIGALILGAIITPPDVTSQLLVMIPIMLLYEISIFISAYVINQKTKKENNQNIMTRD